MPYLVYFPQVVQDLQEEIQKHPDLLVQLLMLPKDSPFELKVAELATYCDVVLDGIYTSPDLEKLAGIFLGKLRAKRGELILLSAPPVNSLLN